jgi:ParB family chromosome partitioning protein
VRENPGFPGTYEIIAGERRWRASKMAGLSELPVIILDGDDLKMAQISLVENVQRENLNPVEEAFAYQALIERFGLTQEQLSREVGRSRSAIANMLRLTDLPDEVLELLKDGKITSGHARAILSLGNEDQMVTLANRVYEKDLSVRDVEKAVKGILAATDVEILKKTDDEAVQRRVYMRDLERRAMDTLGRRVKINQTAKKKTVELTFDSDADLEELLCLLCGDKFFAN